MPKTDTYIKQLLNLYKVITKLRKEKCDCTTFDFVTLPCDDRVGCLTPFEETINMYAIEAFARCGVPYTDLANVKLNLKKIFELYSNGNTNSIY